MHLPASATLLADRHTGNDIGDIIEELAGVAEIDPGRLKARGIGIVGGGQDATHLGSGSVQRCALQTATGEQARFVRGAGSRVLPFDHHHACVAQLERGIDARGRRDRGDVEADPKASVTRNTGVMSAAQAGRARWVQGFPR
jgi:hypothetical protein